MVAISRYSAYLSLLLICAIQLGAVLADELAVTLTIVKISSRYAYTFFVGECLYEPKPFSATPSGGIPMTEMSFRVCPNLPENAPSYYRLTPSSSIFEPYYDTSKTDIPQKCTLSGQFSGGYFYRCGSIAAVTSTTTATTTTTTTTTATSTTTTTTTITTTTTNSPTTTTTTTTLSSTSSSSSTAPAPTSTCVMKTNIYGRKNGGGILKDCCKTSDDCYGSCKKGICDAERNPKTTASTTTTFITKTSTTTPTPTGPCANKSNVTGQKKGNGILGDCCRNGDDCTGSCIKGKCDAVGNPSGEKCISSNYYGKKNGKGPVGVCCKSEADCKNSCVDGKCIK